MMKNLGIRILVWAATHVQLIQFVLEYGDDVIRFFFNMA